MNPHAPIKKTTVDKDLKKIVSLEKATQSAGQTVGKIGLGLLFLAGVFIFATLQTGGSYGPVVIAATVIGGYMALNIGANDVANNVGPAVGSRALTLMGAIAIAAIFESAGALIAGGDVVGTIRKGIINPDLIGSVDIFIMAMLAALLSAALWLNLATFVGAPVSTTHSIVGGVMGSGIAAAGLSAVNWGTMGKIAASWVISPVLGGLIAAAFLLLVKLTVLNQKDKIAASRKWVPVIVAVMACAFSMYLMMKGLKKIWKVDFWMVMVIGGAGFAAAWATVKVWVNKKSAHMENRNKSVHQLFVIPLICSAALLSFAHGANDVANAVGPLAGIVGAAEGADFTGKVGIPIWVMAVGALGISAGLLLFGPKLIRTVGQQITKLNPVRAFCIALASAITVIIASGLGLPVSSTHIAVGGVFGVGFLREFLMNRKRRAETSLLKASGIRYAEDDEVVPGQKMNLTELETLKVESQVKKAAKRKLVRRRHLLTIATAWVVTVPAAAALSALLYYAINGVTSGTL